jgi:hypothetical protein
VSELVTKCQLMSYTAQHYKPQDPIASANLDGRAIKNEPIGVVAEGLGINYVVSVKSAESLPTIGKLARKVPYGHINLQNLYSFIG